MQVSYDEATMIVSGQVDGRSLSLLRSAIYDHLEVNPSGVVLDLGAVESVDLAVLRMIVVASRLAGRRGQSLRLQHCSPAVRRMLHLSHLRTLVQVVPAGERATESA